MFVHYDNRINSAKCITHTYTHIHTRDEEEIAFTYTHAYRMLITEKKYARKYAKKRTNAEKCKETKNFNQKLIPE